MCINMPSTAVAMFRDVSEATTKNLEVSKKFHEKFRKKISQKISRKYY